jgi:hypothetical protein
LRLQHTQKAKLEAHKVARKKKKVCELEKVKIALQEKKAREDEEAKIAMKITEEEKAEVKNYGLSTQPELDSSSTESSKGGSESALSPEQSEDKDPGKYLSVLSYPIFTCP